MTLPPPYFLWIQANALSFLICKMGIYLHLSDMVKGGQRGSIPKLYTKRPKEKRLNIQMGVIGRDFKIWTTYRCVGRKQHMAGAVSLDQQWKIWGLWRGVGRGKRAIWKNSCVEQRRRSHVVWSTLVAISGHRAGLKQDGDYYREVWEVSSIEMTNTVTSVVTCTLIVPLLNRMILNL